ncbi:MAG: hypothetical protein KGK16_10725 [Bradyrhizobium sp.]|nr:hypothetical protein [Bradyrhizobium sp.]
MAQAGHGRASGGHNTHGDAVPSSGQRPKTGTPRLSLLNVDQSQGARASGCGGLIAIDEPKGGALGLAGVAK